MVGRRNERTHQIYDDLRVVGCLRSIRLLNLANARNELFPAESLPMLVDGLGQVLLDLHRKRGGKILGIPLGNSLTKGHQRRPNPFTGARKFETVLDLSCEFFEVHDFSPWRFGASWHNYPSAAVTPATVKGVGLEQESRVCLTEF